MILFFTCQMDKHWQKIEVIHNFVDVKRFNKKPVDAFKKLISHLKK